MSQPRETRFFFDEERYSRGLVNYEINHFNAWSGQKAVGEKTPEYLLHPEVPGRIRESLGPDTRVIITLRSPARRAFSQHRHNFSNRTETLDFDAALKAEPVRTQGGFSRLSLYGYMARGCYADQVERYLQVFDHDKVLILVFEHDIVGKQDELSKKTYEFVGVDSSHRVPGEVREGHPPAMQYHFVPEGKQLKVAEGRTLSGPVLLSGFHPRFTPVQRPSPGLLAHVEAAQKNAPGPESRMSRAEELRLNREHFAQDIERLARLIDRDLSDWLEDRDSSEAPHSE